MTHFENRFCSTIAHCKGQLFDRLTADIGDLLRGTRTNKAAVNSRGE